MAWPQPITIIAGLGGLIAALVMGTLYTRRFPSEPLPSTTFLARIFDGDVPEYEVGGTVLYLAYGGLVGGFFPWFFWRVPGLTPAWVITIPRTLVTGLAFGLLLIGPWTAYRALGLIDPPFHSTEGFDDDLDEQKYFTMIRLHVLYGLVLGFIVGLYDGTWAPLFGL